jgi:hypothetical protein
VRSSALKADFATSLACGVVLTAIGEAPKVEPTDKASRGETPPAK